MALPTLAELGLPFFARPSTKSLVDDLAHCVGLAVYAGAGVTIDQTGVSWSDLVVSLFTATQAMELAPAERLVREVGPLRAATVAERILCPASTAGERISMANTLRDILYRRNVAGGRISTGIASLWIESALRGQAFPILTTNYDTHLEQTLVLRCGLLRNYAINQGQTDLGGSLEYLSSELKTATPIVYLHGRIPKNDPIIDPPVLSEEDYRLRNSDTQQLIAEEMQRYDFLIVGASLTDSPLINALLETRSLAQAGDKSKVKRFAFIERSAIGANTPTIESHALLESFNRRLEYLGVQRIYFDYFAQVGQFLNEAHLAANLNHGEYPASDTRYGARLRWWWTNWEKATKAKPKALELQEQHHSKLLELTDRLRIGLGTSEPMKIEIWLRWDPTNATRELRLWSSSYARFNDWTVAKTVLISTTSKHAAVRAFCEGSTVYDRIPIHDTAEPHREGGVWETVVGMPLRPSVVLGRIPELVVGSILILGAASPETSAHRAGLRATHENHFDKLLRDVVALISDPLGV